MLPDKGKEKAVPDDTAQEGSEPDPSTILGQHIIYKDKTKVLTTCNHTQDISDKFLSKMDAIKKYLDEATAETKRRANEAHAIT